MIYIIKRDGRKVTFNQNKIIDAVLSAFKEVDGTLTDYAYEKAGNIADYIDEIAKTKNLTVEEIQDLVEKGLMATKRKDVAKAYILYREERTKERNKKSKLIQQVGSHLRADNIQNQNANMDEMSFGGRRGEAANALMKQYALDYCMSDMAKENHLNNLIYIHDLDSYAVGMHNCLTLPIDHLLAEGFDTRQTDIRPANSINTAFQLIAVLFQLQSLQQFGGVSASHLDWSMVPYVRKSFYKHWTNGAAFIGYHGYYIPEECDFNDNMSIDDPLYKYGGFSNIYNYALKMTEKELKQAVEGMYHNLSNWVA